MSSLIFLSNELLSPSRLDDLRIPLRYITFAECKAKMFHHFGKHSTFMLNEDAKAWGNRNVYGAMFQLEDFAFHIRSLDAYFGCSLSALKMNHVNDIHHRHRVDVTPITFPSLESLGRLQYTERESHFCFAYFGNPKHHIIRRRLEKTNSYRVIDGIDKKNFKSLYNKEVTQ